MDSGVAEREREYSASSQPPWSSRYFPPVAPCPGRSGTSTAKPRATSQAASARYSGCGILARRSTFCVAAWAIGSSGNGPSPEGRNSSACAAVSGSGDGTSHCCTRAGSASAPCAPNRGCAVALCAPTSPSTTRTKNALHDCMNCPDANRKARLGFARHNTHGESNPVHFSVNEACQNVWSGCHSPATPIEMSLKTPPCPLSVQPDGKTDAQNPQVNR